MDPVHRPVEDRQDRHAHSRVRSPYFGFYNAAVNEVHYVDAVTVERSITSGGGDYFDGAKTDVAPYDFAWNGTADASTSTEAGPFPRNPPLNQLS